MEGGQRDFDRRVRERIWKKGNALVGTNEKERHKRQELEKRPRTRRYKRAKRRSFFIIQSLARTDTGHMTHKHMEPTTNKQYTVNRYARIDSPSRYLLRLA